MQRPIIMLLAMQSALVIASGIDEKGFHTGGYAANTIYKAVDNGVSALGQIQGTLPQTASAAGTEFGRSATTSVLDTLSPEVRKQLAGDMGDAFGRNLVNGVTSEIKSKATSTVQSTTQAVADHPYAVSGALVGLGVVAATIHYVSEYFPSREESARRAELARKEAENKRDAEALVIETEFRTCINKHFSSMRREDRIPEQCHSISLKMNMLNAARASSMIDAANRFRD